MPKGVYKHKKLSEAHKKKLSESWTLEKRTSLAIKVSGRMTPKLKRHLSKKLLAYNKSIGRSGTVDIQCTQYWDKETKRFKVKIKNV